MDTSRRFIGRYPAQVIEVRTGEVREARESTITDGSQGKPVCSDEEDTKGRSRGRINGPVMSPSSEIYDYGRNGKDSLQPKQEADIVQEYDTPVDAKLKAEKNFDAFPPAQPPHPSVATNVRQTAGGSGVRVDVKPAYAKPVAVATTSISQPSGMNPVALKPGGMERLAHGDTLPIPQKPKRREGHQTSHHPKEQNSGFKAWIQSWGDKDSTNNEVVHTHEDNQALLDGYRADFQTQLETKEKRIRELEAKISVQEASQYELESAFRKAQTQLFKTNNVSQRISDQDSTILADFKRLQNKIKAFAKSYAVDTREFLPNLSEGYRNTLQEYLGDVVRVSPGQAFPWKELDNVGKRAPALCVAAAMANGISRDLLSDPFFFIPNHDTLSILYKDLQSINEPEAHIWRSQLLRILDPPPKKTSNNPAAANTAAGAHQKRSEASGYFADNFLIGPASILFKPLPGEEEAEKRNTEASRIFETAGDLSFRLWSERVFLKPHGLGEMVQDRDTFVYNGELLEAHALHKLGAGEEGDEEEDVHRFDGMAPRIVVFPAILRYGTRDADDYGTRRVWSPAVVLMDEPAEVL